MTCGLEHQNGIVFSQGILEALDHNKTMASSVGNNILMALDFNGVIYHRIRSLMSKDCGSESKLKKTRMASLTCCHTADKKTA